MRRRSVRSAAITAAVLIGCSGADEEAALPTSPQTPPSTAPAISTMPSTPPRTEPARPASVGFDVLDVVSPSYLIDLEAEQGRVLAATDEDQLASLWVTVGSSRAQPNIDFDRQFVAAFLVGGSGSCREHVAQLMEGERTLRAVFALALPFEACTDDLIRRYHVVAFDLADLEPGLFTVTRDAQHPDDRIRPVDVVVPDNAPPMAASLPDDVEELTAPVDELPLPARGEASSGRLGDGTPVWVVAHTDGSVTVLEATAPSTSNTFGGRRHHFTSS